MNRTNGGTASEGVRLYQEGVEALEAGRTEEAIRLFKGAVEADRRAMYLSHLGLCLAQYQEEYHASVLLCQEALKKDPKNVLHFVRLGKVQILAGRKKDAIRMLNLGRRIDPRNAEIAQLLQWLGVRKRPVLPFLSRSHPLNKYLGKLRNNLARGR